MDINEITKSDIAENMKYKNTKYKKYETRFTAAESAVHQAKCNICKQNPILGFRFFLVITMIVMIVMIIVMIVSSDRSVEAGYPFKECWGSLVYGYDHDHGDNDDQNGSFHG